MDPVEILLTEVFYIILSEFQFWNLKELLILSKRWKYNIENYLKIQIPKYKLFDNNIIKMCQNYGIKNIKINTSFEGLKSIICKNISTLEEIFIQDSKLEAHNIDFNEMKQLKKLSYCDRNNSALYTESTILRFNNFHLVKLSLENINCEKIQWKLFRELLNLHLKDILICGKIEEIPKLRKLKLNVTSIAKLPESIEELILYDSSVAEYPQYLKKLKTNQIHNDWKKLGLEKVDYIYLRKDFYRPSNDTIDLIKSSIYFEYFRVPSQANINYKFARLCAFFKESFECKGRSSIDVINFESVKKLEVNASLLYNIISIPKLISISINSIEYASSIIPEVYRILELAPNLKKIKYYYYENKLVNVVDKIVYQFRKYKKFIWDFDKKEFIELKMKNYFFEKNAKYFKRNPHAKIQKI
jgi:hypothetical protein